MKAPNYRLVAEVVKRWRQDFEERELAATILYMLDIELEDAQKMSVEVLKEKLEHRINFTGYTAPEVTQTSTNTEEEQEPQTKTEEESQTVTPLPPRMKKYRKRVTNESNS